MYDINRAITALINKEHNRAKITKAIRIVRGLNYM